MTNRPFEIKAHHLARKAVIYVRQSSDAQVEHNRGSTAYQRGQRQFAEAWGWTEEQIEVIDEDLGLTGTTSAHRHGYQRLLKEMAAKEVGAVFVSDPSRLGRDPIARFEFVNLSLSAKVLLVVDGRVADPTDPTKFFEARLTAVLNEYDNLQRREHIRRGIEARIAAGKAVSRPPVGYVRGHDGTWDLDPDPDVQLAVTTIFQTFKQERSCLRTVRALQRIGLKVPSRRYGGALKWSAPTTYNVFAMLKNPHYSGRYVYRQQVCDASLGYSPRGYPRVRRGTADERIVVEAHHAPYVTHAEWDEIQAILHTNSFTADHRNLGPGSALLQGLLRCGHHPHRMMVVRYKSPARTASRPHAYACLGEHAAGGAKCSWVPGRPLDHVVAAAVLQRVSPPAIAALRGALDTSKRQRMDAQRLDLSLLERARRRATDLEQRFMLVNPTNRLVADHLEAQLEEAKREVQRLERGGGAMPPPVHFSATDSAQLERLAADVVQIFYATTTRHRDRKELIRILAKAMTLEKISRDALRVTIEWADGASATVLNVPTATGARARIRQMFADGMTPREIASHLTAAGCITRRNTDWTPDAVRGVLRSQRR